ncbi:hypothetical protein [Polaromonas sp. YR568]|uniref:hypothetical protein n=1 Tax=Polaromonas sp. YR568 TaxID=1855301 RepID=UPI003137F95F
MDEQMRNVNLSLDEIKELMDALSPGCDGSDFESECPGCTAYVKLAAALSQPAAQGDSSHPAGGECGGVTQWQPIETAPKDMGPRLYLVNGRCMQGFIDVGGILNAQTEIRPHWRKMYGRPTHWMPLPVAPKAAP